MIRKVWHFYFYFLSLFYIITGSWWTVREKSILKSCYIKKFRGLRFCSYLLEEIQWVEHFSVFWVILLNHGNKILIEPNKNPSSCHFRYGPLDNLTAKGKLCSCSNNISNNSNNNNTDSKSSNNNSSNNNKMIAYYQQTIHTHSQIPRLKHFRFP